MQEHFELPSETIKKYRKPQKKKKRRGCFLLILLFVLFTAILAGALLAYKYLPNFKQESPNVYFKDINEDMTYIVLNGERLIRQNPPVIENDEVYLPVDFIKEYFDKYIFWEEGSCLLTITTSDKVIKMNSDRLDYYINNKPFELSMPVRTINSVAYLPESLIETLYPAAIEYSDEYNISIIEMTDQPKQLGRITAKNTNMRYKPDIKSPIEKKLPMDTVITVYGEADEKFTKIITDDGLLGYIYTKDYSKTELIEPVVIKKEQYTPLYEGKINMLWDQIYSYSDNLNEDKRTVQNGVNILSPTWFSFDEDKLDGYIINLADKSYVDFAHNNNMQVWALVTDSFKSKITSAILTNPEVREYVIKQLLEYVAMYSLDGINIDFEMVKPETAAYYLQFLRELAPLMREQGAVLSVDMYVPTYTKHYNRTEVAQTVDYICVMAYDEHYGAESGSGPVASIDFVEDGIIKTLEEVPKEKIILGMPFYVRVWREQEVDYGLDVSIVANYAMGYAEPRFLNNGVEFEWLEDVGSYYGEYSTIEDGSMITYKTWLEEERSIEKKLDIYKKYDLAGIAGWSRGLEKDEIWELIGKYINTK